MTDVMMLDTAGDRVIDIVWDTTDTVSGAVAVVDDIMEPINTIARNKYIKQAIIHIYTCHALLAQYSHVKLHKP